MSAKITDTDKKISTYVINLTASVINGTTPPENEGNHFFRKEAERSQHHCLCLCKITKQTRRDNNEIPQGIPPAENGC